MKNAPGKNRMQLVIGLIFVGVLIGLAPVGTWWLTRYTSPSISREPVKTERLTDLRGLEEYPAVSPDGKSVAFSSD